MRMAETRALYNRRALKRLNGLESSHIRSGQKLKLPRG